MPDSADSLRAIEVPEAEPPYDDADPAGPRAAGQGRWLGVASAAGAGPAGGQVALAAGAWPSQFAQVLSETLAGARPASQLTPWTTEQARNRISQLGLLLGAPRRPRVRRVIVSSPAPDVLEMTVIVDMGTRARAIAVRLERSGPGSTRARPGRWLCTAVEAA